MATTNQTILAKKARTAYELGRLKRAARVLAIVLPLVAISIGVCGSPAAAMMCGFGLGVATVGFLWRGQGWGRAVGPGLIAGVAAFTLPVVAHATGFCCKLNIETALCVASGIIAGLGVGIPALRAESEQRERFIAAGIVAALTGSLGCLAIGIGGAIAVVAGVAAITAPLYVFSTARA